jgi:hypothetical protein
MMLRTKCIASRSIKPNVCIQDKANVVNTSICKSGPHTINNNKQARIIPWKLDVLNSEDHTETRFQVLSRIRHDHLGDSSTPAFAKKASVTFEAGQKKFNTSIVLNLAFIPK